MAEVWVISAYPSLREWIKTILGENSEMLGLILEKLGT